MPSLNVISIDKLSRLIGTPGAPVIIDVRTDEDFDADPRLVPGSVRRSHEHVAEWAPPLAGRSVVVVCHHGAKLSHGVAAWLRHAGASSVSLDGGFVAWAASGQPAINISKLPPRDARGRMTWVTRARPKVDRIACAWLIRRFVDPDAIFLFVAPSEVEGVGDRFGAAPFDIDGAFWSHRGDRCTFDVMVDEFGLAASSSLRHLALIVRGADTGQLELAPQAGGLLAVSLGLSRLHADDLEQLSAGMLIYDALYRWCRDAVDETHDWVSHAARPKARV